MSPSVISNSSSTAVTATRACVTPTSSCRVQRGSPARRFRAGIDGELLANRREQRLRGRTTRPDWGRRASRSSIAPRPPACRGGRGRRRRASVSNRSKRTSRRATARKPASSASANDRASSATRLQSRSSVRPRRPLGDALALPSPKTATASMSTIVGSKISSSCASNCALVQHRRGQALRSRRWDSKRLVGAFASSSRPRRVEPCKATPAPRERSGRTARGRRRAPACARSKGRPGRAARLCSQGALAAAVAFLASAMG